MDKIKELLKILNQAVKSPALDAALMADDLKAVEWNDDDIEAIRSQAKTLLSKEAALNNPDIISTIMKDAKVLDEDTRIQIYNEAKGKSLSQVEKDLKGLTEILPVEFPEGAKVNDMIDALRNVNLNNGDSQETINALKSDLAKAHEEAKRQAAEWEEKFKEQEREHTEQQLVSRFKDYAGAYTWSDTIDETLRGALLNQVWSKLKGKAELKFENGEIVPYNKDNPELELYEGNEKLSFKAILEPEIQNYLKKSGGDKLPGESTKRYESPINKRENLNEGQEALIEHRKAMEEMHSTGAV